MVDVEKAARSLGKLTLLKFFPSDPDARGALLEMVCNFSQQNEHIDWLCRRALQVFNEWPGPQELRALYCNRYRPVDGINANSLLFSNGFPPDPEVEKLKIEEPVQFSLPPGHKVSADINIEKAVIILSEQTKMRPMRDVRKNRTGADVAEILEQMGL